MLDKPIVLASVNKQNFSLKFVNAFIGSFSSFPFNVSNASSQASTQYTGSEVEILLNSFTNQRKYYVEPKKDLICMAVVCIDYDINYKLFLVMLLPY